MVDFAEILLIAIVALLLFGPDKLPEYIRQMGRIYGEFKKAQYELEREIKSTSLTSQSSLPSTVKPSENVVSIAKKMGISVEGKTEQQLLREIESAIPGKEQSG